MLFIDYFLKGLKPQFDDDGTDRLNYYYTPLLLVIFALTLSAKQYVGQPIQCWIPAQFTGAWEQYSENYCFVQNTYFISPQENIPDSPDDRNAQEIGYYQWVPFILGLQAILFFFPEMIWRSLNWQSGVPVKSIVRMSKEIALKAPDTRGDSVKTVASHIHDSLKMQRDLRGIKRSITSRGSYLTTLYLGIKILYLVQVLMQFVILNNFLQTKSGFFWGFSILSDLVNGREWEESGHFPRVTLCDFDVRVLGNKHRHTVQCVLMINMFNEKVYLFLWYWILGVLFVTLFNFVSWVLSMRSVDNHKDFVATYLRVFKLIDSDDVSSERILDGFVKKELNSDGILLLRLISKNAGDIITTDIVAEMWKIFLEEEAAQKSEDRPALDDVDGFREKAPLT